MTTKEWLSRGRNIVTEILSFMELKETAFEVATSSTAGAGERVHTTPRNTSEDKFLKYIELSEKVDKKISQLLQTQGEIFDAIITVKDTTDRTILNEYYVNCAIMDASGNIVRLKTLEHIAAKMNYSYMQICRRHGNALSQVAEYIKML